MCATATLHLHGEPASVGEARRLVDERCEPSVPLAEREAVRLMVSELVTNVIRHADRGHGVVRLECGPEKVRVEVEDFGPGVPETPKQPDRKRGGGFGLYLVDRLSNRWGVRDRTCVWFELDVGGLAA